MSDLVASGRAPRAVVAQAVGHGSIQATHGKTLELMRDDAIGPRATCVVAVGARLDEHAAAALRGRVSLTIISGGHSDVVSGRLNPAFRPGDPLVVRRDGAVTRDALIVDADASAADLRRALVLELARPGAEVSLELREVPGAAPGVLVVDPGAAWRSGSGRTTAGPEPDVRVGVPVTWHAYEAALEALELGGHVLLEAAPHEDATAVALVAAAQDAGHTVLPAPGLSPIAAVVSLVGVSPERLVIATARGRARPVAPGVCRVVTGVAGDRVTRWLDGAERGLVSLDQGAPREQHLPWRRGELLRIPGGRGRTAIVVAAGPPRPAEAIDPVVAGLASELLRVGASVREVTHAVQRAAGVPHRRAYNAVLELARRPEISSVSRPEPRTRR